MNKMKLLMALTIVMMSVMSVKAQSQRLLEFQMMMSIHDTTYKNTCQPFATIYL